MAIVFLNYLILIPVSYTHLDVYKRQVQAGSVADAAVMLSKQAPMISSGSGAVIAPVTLIR